MKKSFTRKISLPAEFHKFSPDWALWIGPEVEGHLHKNELTLFVADNHNEVLTPSLLRMHGAEQGISRIWFCQNFRDWKTIRELLLDGRVFTKVCIEVNLIHLDNQMPPDDIRIDDRVFLYFKVPIGVKPGDHVSVGPPREEYTIQIGEPQILKATRADYTVDKRLV